MRRLLVVIAAVSLFAVLACATDVPKMETYLGYNFVRFNPNSAYVPSFNSNGGGGQFAYNFNKWIGGVVDIGAVNKGRINQQDIDVTVLNFVAGPRITWRNESKFQPFGQVLFGGARSAASTEISLLPGGGIIPPGIIVPGDLPVSARLTTSRTGFAMLVGGGLDIRLSKHIAFRPFELDYFLARLPNDFTGHDNNLNNFRYSAGVNFLFGAR